MRFGILSQWFHPEPGPASLPGALARGLAARGHEVEVVTGFPNYPTGVLAEGYRVRPRQVEHHGRVRVTRVAMYPSHDATVSKRLANYTTFAASATALGITSAFKGIDALWVNFSPITIGLPSLAQHLVRGTPTVVHVLDLWPDTLRATGFGGSGKGSELLLAAADRVCQAVYRRAARVAYISPGVGEELSRRGVAREKLAYAPMWADESLYSDSGPNAGAEPDSHIVVLYAGTLGRTQGLNSLIEAFAAVRDLPVRCHLVGSGVEEQGLRALANRLEATNVQFVGRVPEGEMPQLLAGSDIGYVSLNDDALSAMTMPSKMQTILASGRAVLGSVTGDAAKEIRDSAAGWVVAPGETAELEATLRDLAGKSRAEFAAVGRRARRRYEEQFSYTRGVDRIEELLVTAARSGPP